MTSMRGLTMFISDLRNCSSKEQEHKRVYKEIAKIREKFSNTRKNLSAYNKKKYVWKLLYIQMLGYPVDFGQLESINLICSSKYSEKYTGYIAAALLLNEHSEQLDVVANAIRSDLFSPDETTQSLALATIGNIGGVKICELLAQDVLNLVGQCQRGSTDICKKAVTCLVSLYRTDKELITGAVWAERINDLILHRTTGMQLAACSLLQQCLRTEDSEPYDSCVAVLIRALAGLVIQRDNSPDYMYYSTPCPWLQVKILQILQRFPVPPDPQTAQDLFDCLERIISRTDVTKSVNKNNCDHGILFEAINLVIHYEATVPQELCNQTANLIGRFINVQEANIRYIGLETMAKLAGHVANTGELLMQHRGSVFYALQDPDVSIRKRALDVLYWICNETNALEIVDHLLDYLPTADYNIKEDLVLKVAIIAEKFGVDLTWYIDVIVQLITYAGDSMSDDVWHRVVQVVTGFGENVSESVQQYAANKAFLTLSIQHVHENMVKLGSYLLSEFGRAISTQPGKHAQAQFEVIHQHFPLCSDATKAMVLSAYMKMINQYPELMDWILPVFEQCKQSWDPDLQQRAAEYENLCGLQEFIATVLEAMPTYPEQLAANNLLLRRINQMSTEAHQAAPAATPAQPATYADIPIPPVQESIPVAPPVEVAPPEPAAPAQPAIVDLLEL